MDFDRMLETKRHHGSALTATPVRFYFIIIIFYSLLFSIFSLVSLSVILSLIIMIIFTIITIIISALF